MAGNTVRVLPALDLGDSYTDEEFLLVETHRNELGQIVSSIDHVNGRRAVEGNAWVVKSLGGLTDLSHAEAMRWAISYATAFGIPVVYERDEGTVADGGTSTRAE